MSFLPRPLLPQTPGSRKNSPWAMWPGGESPQPLNGMTTLIPDTSHTAAAFVSASDTNSFWSHHPRRAARHDWYSMGVEVLGDSLGISAGILPCAFLLTSNYISFSSAVRPAS